MIEKIVMGVKVLKALALGAVVLGLILTGIILLAPPHIGSALRSFLTVLLASLGLWQIVLVTAGLMILYFCLRDYFAMEAPTDQGLYRIRRRTLDRHPEIALDALRSFHRAQLNRSEQPIPQGTTHVTYSPRHMLDRQAAQVPTIDVSALPPPSIPFLTWFAALVSHVAHVLLLGDTGAGKSTLARALLLARSRTDKIIIIDLHEKFNDWCGLPVFGVGRDLDDAERAIRLIHAEFLRRFKPDEDVGDPITVFIDEFPVLADERKEVVNLVIKWLREARVVKIRVVVISTGGEVKTLGIEGQGSIRENFLQVRLRNFAIEKVPALASIPYPGIMIRGNSKQPPQILDTSGIPDAVTDTVSLDVAWTPVEPPLLTDSDSDAGGNSCSPEDIVESVESGGDNLTEAQKEKIRQLSDAGWKASPIMHEVFGRSSSTLFYKVQRVIKEHKAQQLTELVSDSARSRGAVDPESDASEAEAVSEAVSDPRLARVAALTALDWSPSRIARDPQVFGNDNSRSVRRVREMQAQLAAAGEHGITEA